MTQPAWLSPKFILAVVTVISMLLGGVSADDLREHRTELSLTAADNALIQQWVASNKNPDGTPAVVLGTGPDSQPAMIVQRQVTIKGKAASTSQDGKEVPDRVQDVYFVFDKDHIMLGVVAKQ